ncbi:hypothetical protein K3495_g11088 [Podosphaera aphanis]|nr:hypothetical protein K3495_g11088 [Podosphaera aphanis]
MQSLDLVTWVQQQYGLTVSTVTVGNILKRKQELEEITPSNIDAKKPRVSRHPLLEEALVFWILQCQARNVAVTGNLIKVKARKFREQLEIGGTVEFSNGWPQKFQQRNQLKCIRSHGKSGSAITAGIEQAIPILKNVIKDYQPRDIYNMDETGLFYNLSPDKTIAQKQIEGLKEDQTRITLCLASNADGSDKLEPMIIGHFMST